MTDSYLPYDLLRLISLYVSPGMFMCNKSLATMYDDIWYHDKLLLLYPQPNYKNLYHRYITQGIIMYIKN